MKTPSDAGTLHTILLSVSAALVALGGLHYHTKKASPTNPNEGTDT